MTPARALLTGNQAEIEKARANIAQLLANAELYGSQAKNVTGYLNNIIQGMKDEFGKSQEEIQQKLRNNGKKPSRMMK